MELQQIAEEFCQTPIYYLKANGEWARSPVDGRMPPYDRFISDRAFGQKKRIVQTPGGQLLPESSYIRVGKPTGRTYMVESVNEDLDELGEYLNIYMVREASVEIVVHGQVEETQPSGAKRKTWAPVRSIWGDFDRYGVIHSSSVPIDYSSFTVSVLPKEELPQDCRLEIDGELYMITERYLQLELRQLKVTGVNGQ